MKLNQSDYLDPKVTALSELWRSEAIMLIKGGAPPYAVFESMLASAISARVKLTGREETAEFLIRFADRVQQTAESFDGEFVSAVHSLSPAGGASR